jgi:hypothetical protein
MTGMASLKLKLRKNDNAQVRMLDFRNALGIQYICRYFNVCVCAFPCMHIHTHTVFHDVLAKLQEPGHKKQKVPNKLQTDSTPLSR